MSAFTPKVNGRDPSMIILGLVLAIIGWLVGISVLITIGIILVVVGLILMFVPIGGRTRRYW